MLPVFNESHHYIPKDRKQSKKKIKSVKKVETDEKEGGKNEMKKRTDIVNSALTTERLNLQHMAKWLPLLSLLFFSKARNRWTNLLDIFGKRLKQVWTGATLFLSSRQTDRQTDRQRKKTPSMSSYWTFGNVGYSALHHHHHHCCSCCQPTRHRPITKSVRCRSLISITTKSLISLFRYPRISDIPRTHSLAPEKHFTNNKEHCCS